MLAKAANPDLRILGRAIKALRGVRLFAAAVFDWAARRRMACGDFPNPQPKPPLATVEGGAGGRVSTVWNVSERVVQEGFPYSRLAGGLRLSGRT